jgi:molybdopterin-guanine dinucleotide biosynthesis protein A
MKQETTLIILAGGESSRMGQPKHLLPTPHGTLIDHLVKELSGMFAETVVVGRNLTLSRPGIRTLDDARPEQCPLVGIYSGLCAANTDLGFVLACDLPFVKPELVQHLLSCAHDADIVVPVVNGYYEPLCAVYRRAAIPVIEETLDLGELKITEIYDRLQLCKVPESDIKRFDPELSSFVNLNTPRQLRLLAQL